MSFVYIIYTYLHIIYTYIHIIYAQCNNYTYMYSERKMSTLVSAIVKSMVSLLGGKVSVTRTAYLL